MKVRVHTESGSVYGFDFDSMTWERVNIHPGHEDILGAADVKQGILVDVPEITIGVRMQFIDTIIGPINTTRVVSGQLLDLNH